MANEPHSDQVASDSASDGQTGKVLNPVPLAGRHGSPTDEEKASESALPPTDHGVAAWVTVAGGFSVLFVSFGWITCIGVFQDYYQTHQLSSYSPSTVAWIPSLEACIIFIWGPIVGNLFDNYGPRWLLIVGTFLHVFGLMMVSLCTQYYQFILAQSICSATGASILFFAGLTAVSTWFVRHRALALGITVAGSSLGGIVFPIMVEHLNAKVGFAWTIRICAFLILALCLFANFTVQSRLRHTPKPINIRDYWQPFREAPFATFALGYFLFYLGFFIPYNFIILEAERYGMSSSLAGYLVPVLNAGGSVGRIAPGWLADRIGRFNVMIMVTIFSAIVVLALWIPGQSNGAIIAFCVLYGFSSGAFITLAPAILAQISPLPQLGARQGICFAFIAIASLLSNPIAGALVPNTGVDPFWKLQLFAGMVMVGGAIMITVARIAGGGVSLKIVI
ncbi:monocarboxylate permease-like protein-like protein [Thozetella sp. PMI_491]|nr:monocarboxylate permease-like protein-like protein [Thozetella sp. PMI_491]